MRSIRVALAQIDPALGQVDRNLDLHLRALEQAREDGADLVVFPELSLTGYVLRDQVPDVARSIADPTIVRLAEACEGIDAVVGFVEEGPGVRYHNAAAYLASGDVLHVHRKLYLPTYGLFEEGRDFARGETLRCFDTRFGRAGILVCEDAWHPTSAWLLAQDGAEFLLVCSSGPTRGARGGDGVTSVAVWHDLMRFTAEFQTSFVVYVNRVGYEDGLNFGGGSCAIDPFGRDLVRMDPLESGLATATLEPEVLRRARTVYPLLRDADIEMVHRELGRIRRQRFDLPDEEEES